MDQDGNPPTASAAASAAIPGPSSGRLGVGGRSPAGAVAGVEPLLGIPPDLDLGGDHERCTMFEPALYIQRYTTVCRLLADAARFGVIRKVGSGVIRKVGLVTSERWALGSSEKRDW